MDNDRTAAPAAIAAAILLLLLPAAPARAADAPPCDKCEFLPCVQSELTHYRDTQKMFLDLARKAGEMDMNAFSKIVDEETNKSLDRHNARIKDKPACATRYPEGLLSGDFVARRKWSSLGFGFEDLGGGQVRPSFSAVTDPQTCELRQRQLDALKELMACVDLAIATEKHEKKHVADCNAAKPKTPVEHARFEAAGYAEGIKELEKTVRRIRNKKCPKPQPSHLQGEKARDAVKKTLGAANDRLSMYVKAKGY